MPDRVEILFRKSAEHLLPRGSTLLVACSGGSDSVALLHLLFRIAPVRRLALVVAHLDHGLRRGSASDRRFVEGMAAALGLRCRSDRRPVEERRRKGESPEEAARRVRREFLLEAAADTGARLVVLGHTLDDQAETILMRWARGGGPSALGGMTTSGPGPIVRPLLSLGKADLRAWLRRRRIPFRIDPSNRSLRYDRNRLRRLVVPALAEALNPAAARHLVAAADRLRDDSEFLDSEARRRLRRWAAAAPAGLSLPSSKLARAPLPIARRVARLALERAGSDPRRISARHVEALLGLARGGKGARLDLPGTVTASRRDDRIVLERGSEGHRSAGGQSAKKGR